MLGDVWIFVSSLFVLAAACYLLFITSDPLEEVGGKLGKLLHVPEDVIASTFQALATSGPEIIMAIIAATTFIVSGSWESLAIGERECSGCLNMCFSAMDNLIGIGCLGMIYMMWKKTVRPDEMIVVSPSVKLGLSFYILSSTCLSFFMTDGSLSEVESWVLMIIGISYVLSQFFVPGYLERIEARKIEEGLLPPPDEDEKKEDEYQVPETYSGWGRELLTNGFVYAFLVFALWIFVRECLAASFSMATVGIVSVGGVLIMFTSYVSSFPEFMMTYRYAKALKKSAILSMLFGSNVIDLSFAGFRAIWNHEPMAVMTTGRYPELLPFYIYALPVIAVMVLIGLWTGVFKYKHAYPLGVFYLIYIISGFVLL